MGHSWSFTPLWRNLLWRWRSPTPTNAWSQIMHWNGFTPEWILRCCIMLGRDENLFPQMWHSYGFSPVWLLICKSKPNFDVSIFPQIPHSNGFSPLWLLRWVFSCELWAKALLHTVHPNGLMPRWITACLLHWREVGNLKTKNNEMNSNYNKEWTYHQISNTRHTKSQTS